MPQRIQINRPGEDHERPQFIEQDSRCPLDAVGAFCSQSPKEGTAGQHGICASAYHDEPVEISTMGAVIIDPFIGEAGDYDTFVATLRMRSARFLDLYRDIYATTRRCLEYT